MKAMDLVGYVIMYSECQGKSVTNLRLQKLLYFIQKEYLTQFGRPAFDDEIYAWQYGPVIPAVYHEFSYYTNTPIDNIDCNYDIDENLKEVIKTVVDRYINIPTWQLVQYTHQKTSPWSKAISEGRDVILLTDIAAMEN